MFQLHNVQYLEKPREKPKKMELLPDFPLDNLPGLFPVFLVDFLNINWNNLCRIESSTDFYRGYETEYSTVKGAGGERQEKN